jgi:hypothetical protein
VALFLVFTTPPAARNYQRFPKVEMLESRLVQEFFLLMLKFETLSPKHCSENQSAIKKMDRVLVAPGWHDEPH